MTGSFQRETQTILEEVSGLYQILETLLQHPSASLEMSFLALLGELKEKDPVYCENRVSEKLIKARDGHNISLYEYEVLRALLTEPPKK